MQFDRKLGIGSYFILARSEAEKGGGKRKGEEKNRFQLSPPQLQNFDAIHPLLLSVH